MKKLQVQRKLHEEADKFREYASSLEKEYVSALEKKYTLLYRSTANLVHAINSCKNIITADEKFTDELESTKQNLKQIPSYPSSFQQAQDEELEQLPSFVATGLKRQSEQYVPDCFKPKKSKKKEKRHSQMTKHAECFKV